MRGQISEVQDLQKRVEELINDQREKQEQLKHLETELYLLRKEVSTTTKQEPTD